MLEFVLGYSMGKQGAARASALAGSMAAGDGTRHANRVEDLNDRIDRMLMIIRGMWALLEEQGMTEEQLIAKINEIDAADGVLDGHSRALPVECAACGSKVAVGLRACQICGEVVTGHEAGPLDLA